jgi:NADP-dependent 3-hydroxy acid dehydrogenase YdfG
VGQADAGRAEQVIDGNLSSAFYCSTAVLPMMRKRKDGVLIHTSSMAGRHPSTLAGRPTSAAKHGVVAMSHTINRRSASTASAPASSARARWRRRSSTSGRCRSQPAERKRMAQSEDVGDLIRYVACLPPHIVHQRGLDHPTWNRGYVANLQRARKA